MLETVGNTTHIFTPPSPLNFEVKLSERYSRRRLFDALDWITYKWSINDSTSLPNDVLVWENALSVPNTTPRSAGMYSVAIDSFGFFGFADKKCTTIIRDALKNYAVFQAVDFQAVDSKAESSSIN